MSVSSAQLIPFDLPLELYRLYQVPSLIDVLKSQVT